MSGIPGRAIFCERCKLLALAKLDATPVCEECLFAALGKSVEYEITRRVEPLITVTHSGHLQTAKTVNAAADTEVFQKETLSPATSPVGPSKGGKSKKQGR